MAAILKGLSINKGLVGYWPLGNLGTVRGNVAVDLSGRRNAGTLVGSPPLVPGLVGQALSFNGTTQSVNLPDLSLADFTVNVWAATSSLSNFHLPVIAWDNFSASPRNSIIIKAQQSSGSGLPIFESEVNGTGGQAAANGALTVGTWHMFSIIRSGTLVTIWIDGIVQTNTISVGAGTFPFLNGRVGAHYYNGANQEFLAGSVNYARVYNWALLAQELNQLFVKNRNPNFGLIPSRRLGLNATGAVSSIAFRRTLSSLGTRVGSRQAA